MYKCTRHAYLYVVHLYLVSNFDCWLHCDICTCSRSYVTYPNKNSRLVQIYISESFLMTSTPPLQTLEPSLSTQSPSSQSHNRSATWICAVVISLVVMILAIGIAYLFIRHRRLRKRRLERLVPLPVYDVPLHEMLIQDNQRNRIIQKGLASRSSTPVQSPAPSTLRLQGSFGSLTSEWKDWEAHLDHQPSLDHHPALQQTSMRSSLNCTV